MSSHGWGFLFLFIFIYVQILFFVLHTTHSSHLPPFHVSLFYLTSCELVVIFIIFR
uniref:Uncharacterized protein n=1 Tax=Siphoviridae sp. ctwHj1 TaxID=2825727 RepID=A0A8S5U689_9CAUD|nr:MAG TPA: hypothetical protein [Siphoviridae sp. ctwHj1]